MRLRHRRGSVLITVLLVVVFGSLTLGTLFNLSTTEHLFAGGEYRNTQAYYVAESGLNAALALVPTEYPSLIFADGMIGDQPEGTYSIDVEARGGNLYVFNSYGTIGSTRSLASALVEIIPTPFDPDGPGAVFGNGLEGQLNINNSSSLTSNNDKAGVSFYLDANTSVFGEFSITADDKDDDRTLDLVFDMADGRNLWSENDDPPFSEQYTWLGDNFAGDPEVPFPDYLPDYILAALRNQYRQPAGVPDRPDGDQTGMEVSGFTVIEEENLGNITNKLTGEGYLKIIETSNKSNDWYVSIGELELTGDLVIIAEWEHLSNGVLHLQEVNSNGHALIVVSEQTIWLGSTATSDYVPFPTKANDFAEVFLGSGSVLWSGKDIWIRGDLKPYQNDEITPDDPDDWLYNARTLLAPLDGWGNLGIVCKGELRFHHIKTRGLVYSGSDILAYWLRLDGIAILSDPSTDENGELGLAMMHLIEDLSILEPFHWDEPVPVVTARLR